jgi:hypothetical protein
MQIFPDVLNAARMQTSSDELNPTGMQDFTTEVIRDLSPYLYLLSKSWYWIFSGIFELSSVNVHVCVRVLGVHVLILSICPCSISTYHEHETIMNMFIYINMNTKKDKDTDTDT